MENNNRVGDYQELLLPSNGESYHEDEDRFEEDGESEVSFCKEMKELSILSFPVALSTLCRLVIINTDTAFVGHLGKKYLTASSFGNTWNQFCNNIVFSPGYALNSLCSQAIGAGNTKLAGVWLQLALIVTSLLCIPVLVCYALTEPVVNLMVDEEDVPQLAQDFNYVSMLILWPMVVYMIIRQYFQAMQIVTPAMVVSGLTVGFNYWMNYVFVPTDGPVAWGLKGSPFATFLSMIFQLVLFLAYTVGYKQYHKPYWGGWSWDCLEKSRLQRFFKMVIPMAVGIVLENSGLQLISFSTGHIGETNIAAHAILSSLFGMLWSFYWGVGLALQVRVGAYLGKGNVRGAKMVAKISIALVFIICTLVGALAYSLRTPIAKLFADEDKDPEVVRVVEDSMYALILDYFFACLALCAVNMLEAMAQNRVLMWTLSLGMWAVQVPCSLLFAYNVPLFQDDQVAGIWIGQICGEVFKIVILWTYIARLDWDLMCKQAKQRSEVPTVSSEDEALEHILEEEDEHYDEECQAIPVQRRLNGGYRSAEVLVSAMQAGSPSPFIGSRSPKFVRHID